MNKLTNIITLLIATVIALVLSACSNITASDAASNRYAIVIGVGVSTAGNCAFADKDAYKMAALLTTKGWKLNATGYQQLISSTSSEMQTVNEPTKTNIQLAISGFNSVSSDATVLVFYSGHGYSGNGYLVPSDASTLSDCISPAMLTQWMGALPCKNKILILDSCYSGAFIDTGSSIDASPQNSNTLSGTSESGVFTTAIENLSSLISKSISEYGDPDVLTISACGSDEESYGSYDLEEGVFTYYLLQAASSGDSDGDGYVTTTEAYTYAKKRIKVKWNTSAFGEALLPHISGGTGDLVLYVNN